jgi:multidrug resistance efflux pump
MSQAIKRIPVAGWFGLLLLAFSVGCVVWAMRAHAANDGGSPPADPGHTKAAAGIGHVDVEPGVAKLYTLQPGRVVKVAAHDNDVVEAGAVLVQLDDTLAKADLVRARAALKVAENDRDKAKFLPVQRDAQIAGQTAAVAAKRHELAAARWKRDMAKRLSESKYGVQKEEYEASEEAVKALEEAVKAEEAKLTALEKVNTPPLDLSSAEEQVKAKQGDVDKAEKGLRECEIRAPEKGTVLRVAVSEGDVLGPTPREPAVTFCPADKPRVIRAEIEQEFAGRLFLGQTALVRDDSTNSTVYRGKVTRISDWFSHRRSMLQEPMQFNDVRTLECIITLDPGEKAPLRIGQRVRVTLEAAQ